MKRRVISFISVLALCLSLCPVQALAAGWEPEISPLDAAYMPAVIAADADKPTEFSLSQDMPITGTSHVKKSMEYILNGYSLSCSTETVLKVESTGTLYLRTKGGVESGNGAGIEVDAGGTLYVEHPEVTVVGTTCALDISSDAIVQLSGGIFKGGEAAIQAENYDDLLKDGFAFFDENDNPLRPGDVDGKQTVKVKECTEHWYTYTASTDNTPTHNGICDYCGKEITGQSCMFIDFSADGLAACAGNGCDHTIKVDITIDPSGLVYDGGNKPEQDSVIVKVMLDDDESKTLTEGTDYDYTVEPSARVDVGDFTVTVTYIGKTCTGTYTKTFKVTQAKPVITWIGGPVEVDYTGAPVDRSVVLPKVDMDGVFSGDQEELRNSLVFSYKTGSSSDDFTDGLPTEAGTYEIKASLPEQANSNYEAAQTESCLILTIRRIGPVQKEPEAIANLIYNRTAQKLVTPGTVRDGAVILFALGGEDSAPSDDSAYSESIPTATNAGKYFVWYKVKGTDNYENVEPKKVEVEIQRKKITPDVTLEYTSCVYDGGYKQPTVTVTDTEDNWVLPSTEYTVTYANNQNVSTDGNLATATVTDSDSGNYKIETVKREFKITEANQAALTITKTPDKVTYGDVFTLETTGGSGGGAVTWEITAINGEEVTEKQITGGKQITGIAEINQSSGQVTVTGVGEVTVLATKSGTDSAGDNHSAATAEWTFTAVSKHVTAIVTADSKTYDGGKTATVHAEVPAQDIMSNDTIKIIMPDKSTFSDENAGTGKTVNVVTDDAEVKVNGTEATVYADGKYITEKYIIVFSSAPVTADITPKPVAAVVALVPDSANGDYQYDGKAKEPAVTVTYEENSENKEIPNTEYTVTYRNNVEAGTATVTVTARAGGNYTFINGPVEITFTITKGESAALTSAPQARYLTYNGNLQNLVEGGAASGGHLEYAVRKPGYEPAEDEELNYSPTIPQGDAAGKYIVYFKVVGDSNHEDTVPESVEVTIHPKTVNNPVIVLDLTPENSTYDGTEKTPDVVSVKDGSVVIWEKDDTNDANNEYSITYTNNINAGTAAVHIVSRDENGNYIVNGSTTFTIRKAEAKFTTDPKSVVPESETALTYNGVPQPLVTAGVPEGGTAVYWLDGSEYSAEIPTGTDQGEYIVYAKVLGDADHEDSADFGPIKVTIAPKPVNNPTVKCSPAVFPYDGTEKTPNIIVTYTEDGVNKVIPDSEYIVTFGLSPRIEVGTYNFTVAAREGGNYEFTGTGSVTGSFEILPEALLSIVSNKPTNVYYGDTFTLTAVGGVEDGDITWSIADTYANVASVSDEGEVTVNGTGEFTVTAKKGTAESPGDDYNTASISFVANPKPITLNITAADKDYDGTTEAKVSAKWNNGDLVSGDTIEFTVTGTFDTANVGTNKRVSITVAFDDRGDPKYSSGNYVTVVQNYEITYSAACTASIYQVDAELREKPKIRTGTLVYDGITSYKLLSAGGATVNNIGVVEYSLSEKGEYSAEIPKAMNAGTYTVWYRVADSVNWKGIAPVFLGEITIRKATPTFSLKDPAGNSEGLTINCTSDPERLNGIALEDYIIPNVEGTFAWADGSIEPVSGKSYSATFTPSDAANYEPVTITVTVILSQAETGSPGDDDDYTGGSAGTDNSTSSGANIPPTEEPGAGGASTQTTVRGGTASTVVSAAAGNKLVDQAVANQSENVVIKPEITGDVTKTEVSVPASAVSRIGSETDAALTVSTPVADVTIPNAALDSLARAGGTVSIVTEQVENMVVLTLTADGRDIVDVPGGLTLSVPVEDVGPGTVAVLVYEDGTRETIRKSVAEGSGVRIPLNGSATVEIVDNRKTFADVPAENWAADAVAFASAHELFNGTSEATFSPNLSMSRAMLATVLYNLEGHPEQSMTREFSDVDSGTWYTPGILWAAENGIVSGYGNGEFGPDNNITREQFAVMLWRYAGCPAADEQTLNFTDADQVSSYAVEALGWAAENGILRGPGSGYLDPGGVMTRAHAAQLLKNFLENT